ncbi:MAG: hypothetical protein KAH12_05925 [Anaerolineales bacterium]|nr:hypothetical protein [Anaerolineales bacterium]
MKINKKTPEFQSGGLSVSSNITQRQATEIHLQDLDARDGSFGFVPFFHDEFSVPKPESLSRQEMPGNIRKVVHNTNKERLTSNCALGVSILSLGENIVHCFHRVDSDLSITSIDSIISTLVAPRLHRISALRAGWSRRSLRPRTEDLGRRRMSS